ncbi:hypothetical protein [Desulfotignum phosphitoxidans]|uniref:hypothetical protein n=1 Tax=Desulfotignum phosphitoxidans TaxID=190898 RepID=UPI00191C1ED0|nr:hypothetical protein [Desulfotignum phosphitoxidans]
MRLIQKSGGQACVIVVIDGFGFWAGEVPDALGISWIWGRGYIRPGLVEPEPHPPINLDRLQVPQGMEILHDDEDANQKGSEIARLMPIKSLTLCVTNFRLWDTDKEPLK